MNILVAADWVVLPVANFDAYFGTTSFGRKYLRQIPETILERSETGFGLCRYRLGGTLVISRDRIRHPSPLLPLEMDACLFQNDSVRLPVPTPDGIRR